MKTNDLGYTKEVKVFKGSRNDFLVQKEQVIAEVQPEGKSGLNQALGPKAGYSTDVCGSPSESTDHNRLGAIRREWHQELIGRFKRGIAFYVNPLEPTFEEIRDIETQVRKELYPESLSLK